MMFTKYIIVVDDDVDVHNTTEVLFHLTANTDPQRDSIFTKGPSDVLDHTTNEIAIGSKLGIDATKKIPGEGFKRAWRTVTMSLLTELEFVFQLGEVAPSGPWAGARLWQGPAAAR